MSLLLGALSMIFWVVRLILVFAIISFPFTLYVLIHKMLFNKWRGKLKQLRETDWYWGEIDYFLGMYEHWFGEFLWKENKVVAILRVISIVFAVFLSFSVFEYEFLSDRTMVTKRIEKELYSMKDNQGFYIHGTRRHIGGADEIVYYFTEKTGENSFKQKRLQAKKCTIIEQDIKEPYIVYNCSEHNFLSNKWHSFITLWIMPYDEPDSWTIRTATFYIPYNSIDREYEIDNE